MGEVIRQVVAQYRIIREGDVLVRKQQKRTDHEAVMGDFATTVSDLGVATRKVMERHAASEAPTKSN